MLPLTTAHIRLMGTLLFLLFLAAPTTSLFAQSEDASQDSVIWVERSWSALPSLFYSPKTRIGGGGSVRFFPRRIEGTRPTNIQFSIIYTARKQMVVSLVPDIFFKEKRRRLFISALYLDFPDFFFGIGNDTEINGIDNATNLKETANYTANIASFLVSGEQEIRPNLSMGLQSWIRYERVSEIQDSTTLATRSLTGSDKGTAVGTGVFFRWDTRDNFFYTYSGNYIRGAFMHFPSALGSDYEFSRATLDIRRFIPLSWRYIVALRAYNQAAMGDAPFQLLPQIGGRNLMRGYQEGRFKHNVLSVVQAEFRGYIWGPISGAVFASIGDVQQRYDDLLSDKLIFAGGAGLRFLLNDEGLNFRFDFARGRTGNQLYFTLGEAF